TQVQHLENNIHINTVTYGILHHIPRPSPIYFHSQPQQSIIMKAEKSAIEKKLLLCTSPMPP
ncbi:hypothetical protein P7M40_24250, partial [Vibrio parahaemolyticus]|nr:hypothetical protein [Vibrio parahaemolyticus]